MYFVYVFVLEPLCFIFLTTTAGIFMLSDTAVPAPAHVGLCMAYFTLLVSVLILYS